MNEDLVRPSMIGMIGRKRAPVVWAAALALVTAVHLVAQLVAQDQLLADATQILLMPLLFGAVYCATAAKRPLLVRLVLIALVFSWLGDTVPRFMGGDNGFLMMVGCFLVAQLFYIAALWPLRRSSVATRGLPCLPYLAAFCCIGLRLWARCRSAADPGGVLWAGAGAHGHAVYRTREPCRGGWGDLLDLGRAHCAALFHRMGTARSFVLDHAQLCDGSGPNHRGGGTAHASSTPVAARRAVVS